MSGEFMLYIEESESIKHFKKCIADICDDDVATVIAAVYGCLELFKVQYENLSNWMKVSSNQTEWFGCLAILAKDILVKEINHELPFGTTNGVYITLLFFKAVAINEDEQTLNAMSECLEKFNRIGCQISNNCDGQSNYLFNQTTPESSLGVRVH
jgi:hypothetical protein